MFKATDEQLNDLLEDHIYSRDSDNNKYHSIYFDGMTRTDSGIAVLTELISSRKEIERQREHLKISLEALDRIRLATIHKPDLYTTEQWMLMIATEALSKIKA